jgi:hypothetical protein
MFAQEDPRPGARPPVHLGFGKTSVRAWSSQKALVAPPRCSGSPQTSGLLPSSSARPAPVVTGTKACNTNALRSVQGPTVSTSPSSSSAIWRNRLRAGRANPRGTQAQTATSTGKASAVGRVSAASPQAMPVPKARPERGVFTHSALSSRASNSMTVNGVSVSR